LSAWFLLSLFLIQLTNLLIRKTLIKLGIAINEYYLFLIFLALGIVATYLASVGYNTSFYLILGRTFFGLPFVQLGYLYKTKLEKFDKPSLKRIFVLFGIQLILVLTHGDFSVAMVDLNFGGRIIEPFISSFTESICAFKSLVY